MHPRRDQLGRGPVAEEVAQQLTVGGPHAQLVDADAVRTQRQCPRLGETTDAPLRGVVEIHPGPAARRNARGAQHVIGRDVHDVAAAVCGHHRRDRAAEEVHALQVRADVLVEVADCGIPRIEW